MLVVRVRGVKTVKSKGKRYYYHRKTNVRLVSEFGSAAFLEEVELLNQGLPTGKTPPKPGTLGALIAEYRSSPEFVGNAERTKADYRKVLDYLEPAADMPLVQATPDFVFRTRDAAFADHKRRFANYVVQIISAMFNWGMGRGRVSHNPASQVQKIRRPKGSRQVNRPWTEAERAEVLAATSGGVRVIVALGMYAAFREGDAVIFTRRGYNGQAVEWKQGKTDGEQWMPAHRDLRLILDAAIADEDARRAKATVVEAIDRLDIKIAISQRGAEFTESGFRASFFKIVRKLHAAGKVGPGLTFHGLRHDVGKLLADDGADPRTIAAILGHSSLAMAQHYSDQADRRKRARAGIRKLERTSK